MKSNNGSNTSVLLQSIKPANDSKVQSGQSSSGSKGAANKPSSSASQTNKKLVEEIVDLTLDSQ
jgi:hypothetical protein